MNEINTAIEALRNTLSQTSLPIHDAIMALTKVGVEEIPQMKLQKVTKRDSRGKITRVITVLTFGTVETQVSEEFANALFQNGVANYL